MTNARKDDGGQAFPGSVENPGMTLRDWFAGQALAGLMADGDIERLADWGRKIGPIVYSLADAMLAERRREVDDDGGQ